jgi:histidinol phosphatase-like PHP family hydrolase
MRLWIKDEVEVPDQEAFMDLLVERTVQILNSEPIDIYVNPTFLPDIIAAEYDALWTHERMQKVIDAAARNGVAIEINSRYRLPRLPFLRLAKAAGLKFSLGTNNGDAQVGDLGYSLEMIRQLNLTWKDMFMPKPEGQKPVQVRQRQ